MNNVDFKQAFRSLGNLVDCAINIQRSEERRNGAKWAAYYYTELIRYGMNPDTGEVIHPRFISNILAHRNCFEDAGLFVYIPVTEVNKEQVQPLFDNCSLFKAKLT